MQNTSRRGLNQGELVNILRALGNRIYALDSTVNEGGAGLAGSSATQIDTKNEINYEISGVLYYLGIAAYAPDLTGLVNTGAGEFCKLRIEVNSGGTVSVKQGGIASAQARASVPPRSASKATLGYVEIPDNHTFGVTTFAGLTYVNGDPDLSAQALEA